MSTDNRQVATMAQVMPVINRAMDKFTPVLGAAKDRWLVAVQADCMAQDKLRQALVSSPETVFTCLAVAANYGLLPGSAYAQFYLIPRFMGGRMQCTFIMGYKGMMELARRHPDVVAVECFLVYQGEHFRYSPSSGQVDHVWDGSVDRSPANIVAGYSRVELANGKVLLHTMSRAEVEAIAERSSAKGTGPWKTDYAAMFRKTVLRSHFNGGSIPRSEQLTRALVDDVEHPQSLGGATDIVRGSQDRADPESAPQRAASGLRAAAGLPPKVEAEDVPAEYVPEPADMFYEEAMSFIETAKDKKAALAAVDIGRFNPDEQAELKAAAGAKA